MKAQLSKEDEKTLIEKVKEFGAETIFDTINLETMMGIDTMLGNTKIQVYGIAAKNGNETPQVCFWVFADGYDKESTDSGFCDYTEIEADVFDQLLNTLFEFPEEPKEEVEPKKMLAVVKLCLYDFNHDIKICAVTADKATARIILQNEIENEKDEQAKGDIHYDTENQTPDSYEAYNEGYEATDSVHIFITETDYIEEIVANS
jgi:hypothetical protein